MPISLASQKMQRPPVNIDFASKAILGAREAQEDYSCFQVGFSDGGLLAVLADGMGGHTSGEVASAAAVEAFSQVFCASPAESVASKLGASLNQANNVVTERIKTEPSLNGMGCTLVAVFINSEGMHWISVGDSPLFLWRDKRVIRVNADHSMMPVIQDSLRRGEITSEEAASHPNRNALRSALTGESLELIDAPSKPMPLIKGDVVILASDGLLSLSEAEIAEILSRNKYAKAEILAKKLITAVEQKKRPRQDNTTVQIIVIPKVLTIPPKFSPVLLRLSIFVLLVFIFGFLFWFLRGTATSLPVLNIFPEKTPAAEPQPVPVPRQEAAPDKSDGADRSNSKPIERPVSNVGVSVNSEPLGSTERKAQPPPQANHRTSSPTGRDKDSREAASKNNARPGMDIIPRNTDNLSPPEKLDLKSTNASNDASSMLKDSKNPISQSP